MCSFCDKGCTIHDDAPESCKEFECAYYQGGENIELRPDKCHVIFEKMSDTLFIGTLDARFEITEIAKGQIRSFLRQGYTVRLGASDFRKPITWQPTEQI